MPSYCLKAHLTAKAVTSGGEQSQRPSSQPGAHSAKAKHIPMLRALSAPRAGRAVGTAPSSLSAGWFPGKNRLCISVS